MVIKSRFYLHAEDYPKIFPLRNYFLKDFICQYLHRGLMKISNRELCRERSIANLHIYHWIENYGRNKMHVVNHFESFGEESARFRKLPTEATLDKEGTSHGSGAKVITTDQKRETVEFMCNATSLSQLCTCKLAGLSLSTCRYKAQRPAPHMFLS